MSLHKDAHLLVLLSYSALSLSLSSDYPCSPSSAYSLLCSGPPPLLSRLGSRLHPLLTTPRRSSAQTGASARLLPPRRIPLQNCIATAASAFAFSQWCVHTVHACCHLTEPSLQTDGSFSYGTPECTGTVAVPAAQEPCGSRCPLVSATGGTLQRTITNTAPGTYLSCQYSSGLCNYNVRLSLHRFPRTSC